MIENIIDHRGNKYSAMQIKAIIEPSCNDNTCKGATQFPTDDTLMKKSYEERENISVREAIKWGNSFKFPVTLYLYDDIVDEASVRHRKELEKILRAAMKA